MDAKTKNYTGWQSDVIVDMIKRYDFPYITLNPGASFRGLHDSLVNYGDNEPPMMLCNHEEIAVQIAHGYAKATGKPMAVILHNLVGLLHACMAIYYAYPRPRADLHHGRHRPDGRGASAARTSTGPTPRWCRATRCATTPSGTTSRPRSTACRRASRAPIRS